MGGATYSLTLHPVLTSPWICIHPGHLDKEEPSMMGTTRTVLGGHGWGSEVRAITGGGLFCLRILYYLTFNRPSLDHLARPSSLETNDPSWHQ